MTTTTGVGVDRAHPFRRNKNNQASRQWLALFTKTWMPAWHRRCWCVGTRPFDSTYLRRRRVYQNGEHNTDFGGAGVTRQETNIQDKHKV